MVMMMTMASTATATATYLFYSSSSLNISPFALRHFSNPQLIPFPLLSSKSRKSLISPFLPCSAVQDITVEEENKKKEEKTLQNENEEEEDGGDDKRRKLYVGNLPWSFTAPDMEKLFGECGIVKDVEIIKQENGKSRGFAFITMSSREEADAVVEKFNSYELMGRTIKVEFANSFSKPAPPPSPDGPLVDAPPPSPDGPLVDAPPPSPDGPVLEGRHKIYASNLAWKVRSINLRNIFSKKFKPISARVVFDSPTGRSAGYGFVGFATKEEAEAAVSEMDGKELMGRPLRLRISEKKGDASRNEQEDTEQQSEES